jgi:large subunit ribosomal protein L6
MSRIGKQPIPVPAGVKVDIKGQQIAVTGKNGNGDPS